eukprot:3802434-Prorocentrum_lima.AAC.1
MPPPCPRCEGPTTGRGVGWCRDASCRANAQLTKKKQGPTGSAAAAEAEPEQESEGVLPAGK